MKQITTFFACLMMVFCMSAFAQTSDTMNNNNSGTMKSDTMTGKKMHVVGCVQEKDGNYMLVNKKHPDGIMLMGSDMKPHVGHKVKVMGMMEKSSANGDMNSGSNMGTMDLNVTKVKMISTQCSMNGTMNQ